ncbi:MAG: LamG domain-containing protein [Candidatus Omnitrophica bacterium]|nr:LamG domain-containing protein [Candidatus Omnitrophota bacterium]
MGKRLSFLFFLVAMVSSQVFSGDPSLILYLSLDKVENGLLIDQSDYACRVKLPSEESLVEGKIGRGLNTGKGYFLTVPFAPQLCLPRGTGLTISLWVKLEKEGVRWAGLIKNDGGKSTAYREFKGFNWGTDGSSRDVLLTEAGWRFTVKGEGSETVTARPIIQLGGKDWAHLAAVYDPSARVRGLFLYVNGELVEDYVMIDMPEEIGTEEAWIIGKDLTCFPGVIDEIMVFKRPLSAEEIKRIYQKTK